MEAATERLNAASTPFLSGIVRPVDEPSPFANFVWPTARDSPTLAPDLSTRNHDAKQSSPIISRPFSARSRTDSPRPPSLKERDSAFMPPSLQRFIEGEGEDTPVLPVFSNMNSARTSIAVPRKPSSSESLVSSTRIEDFQSVKTSQSPASFQPSSGSRSIPSPPMSSIGSDGIGASISLDSSSSFESQLRSSPFIHDLLDRLIKCESATRDVQRELGLVHKKVNILLERSMAGPIDNGELEFRNPFANSPSAPIPGPAGRFSISQPDQNHQGDELHHVNARLNSLTSSVSQLLALQTQHHLIHNSTNSSHTDNISTLSPLEVAPKQMGPSGNHPLGQGFPMRPDMRGLPRGNNIPMRTWSTGNIDLMRNHENGNMMSRNDGILRGGKRGSIAPISRRESVGVLDHNGEQWNGGNVVNTAFKWDNLSLVPELLRSIVKFGVGPPNKIQQRALPFLLKGADIIAQAPPTQERIAAYVIPAINLALGVGTGRSLRGPVVLMVSTTVDQATQAQRMIRDLGGPIGIRSALGVGALGTNTLQELRLMQQNMPHILCGTPAKLHALFTTPGGLSGSEVRMLILDEVDQLIARNLHEFVLNIVKLLPPPRSRPKDGVTGASPASSTPGSGSSTDIFPPSGSNNQMPNMGRRFSTVVGDIVNSGADAIERQTALFSNTVPQDVLNLANTIQLREPIRVLVRRDGNISQTESGQSTRGLRQFYLYLAFTGGSRAESSSGAGQGGGLGIIGSGRAISNPETAQAREWKLDALADLFEDLEILQAIVHVGGMTALESVTYKLANRGLEAIPLHNDMNPAARATALNKFRNSLPVGVRPVNIKVLVVYDVQIKTPDVFQIPLVINYDLPKAVEEYAHRVAPAISSNFARAGVVVNFVTATGGDVEMLRSIECFYKIKCPEVPMSLRDLL